MVRESLATRDSPRFLVPSPLEELRSGTGATLAGMAAGLGNGQRATGFAALKGAGFLAGEIEELQVRTFGQKTQNWALSTEFHFGGFARRTRELDRFIEDTQRRHGLALKWVDVAKMMFGIFAHVEAGEDRSRGDHRRVAFAGGAEKGVRLSAGI